MKNEIVTHKVFGEGIIKELKDNKYITVSFPSYTKEFVYPDAFEKFLVAKNKAFQNEAEKALKIKKEREEAELNLKKMIAHEKAAKKAAELAEQKNYIKASYSPIFINSKLTKGKIYGTNAKKTYSACANAFCWDKNEAKNFGWQTLNYSNIATPEGYSVWFLAHNNWTGTYTYNVKNKITETYMEQWWMDSSHPVATKRKRIIFAKKDNKYIFLGVFEYVGFRRTEFKDGMNYYVERFDLVSETYPE